jgi:hypothetical protein
LVLAVYWAVGIEAAGMNAAMAAVVETAEVAETVAVVAVEMNAATVVVAAAAEMNVTTVVEAAEMNATMVVEAAAATIISNLNATFQAAAKTKAFKDLAAPIPDAIAAARTQ